MVREIEVSIPPHIATVDVRLSSALTTELESAMQQITLLDNAHAQDLQPLGMLLLRTESVASSKIERIQAGLDDYARALHGDRANESATAMAAATEALRWMIDEVDRSGRIQVDTIRHAHRALMADDPTEQEYAGRFRDVQNWIGGSDHSPRGALYVPPPWEEVEAYMHDLVAFSNRDDIPVLAQAALAHAQFESIHPHTDGNGRIGRALVNAILRRRRATTKVVVPIASALVARRERYFDLLDAYRAGDAAPLVFSLALAARIAAGEARETAVRLNEATAEMRAAVGEVRRGSAAEGLLDLLPSTPILTAEEAVDELGSSQTSTYDAIYRLAEAGVLRPLTSRKRNQVWGAVAILDELDDLGRRIEAAARDAWRS